MPDKPQTPLKQVVTDWVRATLDENPPWLRLVGKFLFILASPILLLFFVLDFPQVLKSATEEEPMDAVPPGIIGTCMRGFGYVVAFIVLPFILLVGVFQTLFGTAPEDDPNEII